MNLSPVLTTPTRCYCASADFISPADFSAAIKQWTQPFFPVSQYYKNIFLQKIHKVSVSVAESCPNREGLKGMKTCVFCDVWGSAAYPLLRDLSLREQIIVNRDKIRARYHAEQFFIYFQAYTNTFTKMQKLKEQFDVALEFPEVKGLVVGTRPDCVSEGVLNLWNAYSQKTFMAVELGVQSFFNPQMEFLRRGHSVEVSLTAIHKIREKCPNVDLGIHLIFGLPNETMDDVIATAKICNELPIDNVKLHNLHVLKNTELESLYARGEFKPIELNDYADRVIAFLQHLKPQIAVHRLSAVASRWDELVAPEWVKYKMFSTQYIIDQMKSRKCYQGMLLTESKLHP